jgi:hypothetical protein
MLRFFRIERPTTTTLRPHSTPTSAACCMRWMFDANEATRIFPRAAGRSSGTPRRRAARSRVPGPLGVRRVAEQEVDAAVADLRERADVGLEPVDGRVVELPVAGVDDAAGAVSTTSAASRGSSAPRGRARRGTGRARAARRPARLDELRLLPRPCSSSFDLTSASVSGVAIDRVDVDLAQEVRQPADVILVAVREHDRAHAASVEVARCPAGGGRRRGARRAGTRARRRRR